MARRIEDDIEQFDANEKRFLDMKEEIPLRVCPICFEVSPGALGCGCFTEVMSGDD